MAIFSHSSFTMIAADCMEELEKVAKRIEDYLGEFSKNSFIDACRNDDCSEANSKIESLLCKLTGMTNSNESLNSFAERFLDEIPELERVFDTSFEEEKILILREYSDKLLEVIGEV